MNHSNSDEEAVKETPAAADVNAAPSATTSPSSKDPTITPKSVAAAPAAEEKETKIAEEDAANIVSKIFFSFATPVFTLAWRRRRAAAAAAAARGNAAPQTSADETTAVTKEDEAKAERAARGELEEEDFWTLSRYDRVDYLAKVFQDSFKNYVSKKGDSSTKRLTVAIYHTTKHSMITAGLIKLVNSGLQLTFPFFLRNLLYTLQPNSGTQVHEAYLWSLGLGLAMLTKALTENSYFWYAAKSGWRGRAALNNAVFRKSLKLSLAARQSKTLGEIVNLMQLDAAKIELSFGTMHFMWDGALQIIGYTLILFWIIDWAAFVGLAFMLTLIPIQGMIVKTLIGIDRGMVKITDNRVKIVNEAIQGISGIKMSSWEESLSENIGTIRDQEVKLLRRSIWFKSFSSAYMSSVPAMTAVIALSVYATVIGGTIDPSILFSALSAFNQLRFPLMLYPMALAQFSSAIVSRKRLADFFAMEEVSFPCEESEKNEEDLVLELDKVTVFWADPETAAAGKASPAPANANAPAAAPQPFPALSNVSLKVKRGELVAIVGGVGQGKTALVNTLLREMFLASGKLTIFPHKRDDAMATAADAGFVSFASQTPWIVNASVRANILFGSEMDKEWYDRVIQACQLITDLQSFENYDETEIGERGVSLSGGQKQRIAIARAAYKSRNSAMVILDDPLSALDPAVANQLFEECILGLLSGQTRVIVTNNLDVLKSCDRVIVVDRVATASGDGKGGEVAEQGTYAELMANPTSHLAQLIAKHRDPETAESRSKDKLRREKSAANTTDKAPQKGRDKAKTLAQKSTMIIKAEERAKGAVGTSLYHAYIKAGGGYLLFSLTLGLFLISLGFAWLNTYWITLWTGAVDFTNGTYLHNDLAFYLVGFALTAIFMALFTFLRTGVLMLMAVRATSTLHKQLLRSVLHAPTRFFDQTPTGRILQRFSYDVRVLDYETGEQASLFLFTSLFVLMSIGTIVGVTPIFAAFIVPLAAVYWLALEFYRPVMRDAKRLGSIATSPVYSNFSETLGGVVTVRAFRAQDQFLGVNIAAVDRMVKMVMGLKLCERWLGVRLELMGSAIALITAMLVVQAVQSGSITAGLAGLSLNYAMNTTSLLNMTVRSFAALEAAMNSVERVQFMGKCIEQERWRKEDYEGEEICPPEDWPQRGEIEVTGLSLRYREDTPLILKSLDFTIRAGEKIGIAGRTGSGKSTLFLALLRIVEPMPGSVIKIDGLDVSKMTLFNLRSRISIAPQLPVLFSGTLRYNLDPFGRYSDAELWAALDSVGMQEAVRKNNNNNSSDTSLGLETRVSEYGENFSQGERQLISLCRAVLAKPRILLLDEASASLDMTTDALIQRTIRDRFKDATMLVIAHRIDTISLSDRIMVLGEGRILEFDAPLKLLENPHSELSLAVEEMGAMDRMRRQATSKLDQDALK